MSGINYRDILELVVKREMGILGKERTLSALKEAEIISGPDGELMAGQYSFDEFERFMGILNGRFGAMAIMGCKIAVIRAAQASNLPLPAIFTK